MAAPSDMLFLTGATGLVGGAALRRMLAADEALEAVVLVRDAARWRATAEALGIAADRVTPLVGDVTQPGLGLSAPDRARLARAVTIVVHAAADVVFSRPLPVARAVNTEGTRHVLEAAIAWPRMRRLVYVSTAFVAGRRTGRVIEQEGSDHSGWVNAYEQSKHEAEQLVRASGLDWLILRPSTIVCDSTAGGVTQYNAVHLALRLLYDGLAPMLPAAATTGVDVVPRDYIAAAVAALAGRPDLARRTLHLCAGSGALAVGELLDLTWQVWSRSPEWRRRSITPPTLADAATYRRFEETVEEAGDRTLKAAVRALSHFAPQLALPKTFDTSGADAALGARAPAVRDYWASLVGRLPVGGWDGATRRVAA